MEITSIKLPDSEWLRGQGSVDSYLIRTADYKKCCVGIAGLHFGVEAKYLEDIQTPEQTGIDDLPAQLQFLIGDDRFDSVVACTLMEINDDKSILTDDERVARLNEQTEEFGIKFVFSPDE